MLLAYFDRESLYNYQSQLAMRGIQATASKRKYALSVFYGLDEVTDSDTYRPILVFCNSERRSLVLLKELCEKNYHPIFIAARIPESGYSYSSVSIDYRDACFRMTRMLLSADASPIAFVGFNNDSVPDKLRLRGFESAIESFGARSRIFPNFGDISACVDEFMAVRDEYKNVICVNDFNAVMLIRKLKEANDDPAKYRICGFGNTNLSRYSTPSLTTADINYELAGRYGVELYSVIERMSRIQSLTLSLKTDIYVRESSGGEKLQGASQSLSVGEQHKTAEFYNDSAVKELDSLDIMLSSCDEIDINILRGLVADKTYSEICDENYIAMNTAKYRIKKMTANADAADKNELVGRIRQYSLSI